MPGGNCGIRRIWLALLRDGMDVSLSCADGTIKKIVPKLRLIPKERTLRIDQMRLSMEFSHPNQLLNTIETASFHLYTLDIVMPMVNGQISSLIHAGKMRLSLRRILSAYRPIKIFRYRIIDFYSGSTNSWRR